MIERKFLVIAGFLVTASWMTGDVQAKKPGGPPGQQAAPVHSWDQILPADDGDLTTGCNSSRFTCVMPTLANPDGEGVLDNETGLVWELSPDTGTRNWASSRKHCARANVGDRLGWRLPTFHELASLVDLSVPGFPKLPNGHPFVGVQASIYWSVSTRATDTPNTVWFVNFFQGGIDDSFAKTNLRYAWCVRGGVLGPAVH